MLRLLTLLVFLSAALLTACSDHHETEKASLGGSIEIRVNQSGDELMQKYPGQFNVSKHPAGLSFYTMDWPSDGRGSVVIAQSEPAFTIPYALGVSGTYNSELPNEKITDWYVSAGITAGDLIGHDEARHRFFDIIQSIRQAGWQRVILFSDPRLKGQDNLQYVLNESSVSYLDPDYVPDLDEWMMLGNRSTWGFYANHAYLTVTLTRDPTRTDISKPGAYFIEYALTAENEEMRSYVDSRKRPSWKVLLPGELLKAKREREKIEAVWKSKGAQIDLQYQDPPIPDLSP